MKIPRRKPAAERDEIRNPRFARTEQRSADQEIGNV